MSGQAWLLPHQSVYHCQVAAACRSVMCHGLHHQPIMPKKVLVAAALICPVDELCFLHAVWSTTITSYPSILIKGY